MLPISKICQQVQHPATAVRGQPVKSDHQEGERAAREQPETGKPGDGAAVRQRHGFGRTRGGSEDDTALDERDAGSGTREALSESVGTLFWLCYYFVMAIFLSHCNLILVVFSLH